MGPVPSPGDTSESSDIQSSHFSAGSAGEGVHLGSTTSGPELILKPAVVADFGGGILPADWFVETWKDEGTARLHNGTLRLEGARAGYSSLFGSNRSLEFVATFSRRPHQHVGFGTNFQQVPWVSFSTKFGHSVYARSNFFIPEDNKLSPALLGSPHRYRISWNVIDLEFWVDGQRMAHQLVPIVGYMRPLASNGSLGGDPLEVEWMRMSPYRPEGVFTSRVHDAGAPAAWAGCDVDADQPPNTAVRVEVRAGDGPEPDGSWAGWSGWSGLTGAADPRPLTGRYAQYRVVLSTADPAVTPVLRGVSLRYSTTDGSSGSSSSGPS